ncbi:MAG: Gfo/Idh/MocA family oxidoreductase [Phycisphaerales bacterium]|nr:Gfo/Idh/MocA family oxidoreductase [Phycisphaerales bacterium]
MLRIGHVDLGTTHPAKFIETERALGYDPIGVFDDFRILSEEKSRQFAVDNKVHFFDNLDDLADHVDVACIHSVNWDLHLPKLLPFINRGKGVYLDKPCCGNLADIQKIKALVKDGNGKVRITGCSMIIFTDEVKAAATSAPNVHLAFAGGPNEIYYYGSHVYYLLGATLGYDFARVRYLGTNSQKMFDLEWTTGKKAVIAIGESPAKFFPFYLTLLSDAAPIHYSIKAFLALKNMLTEVIPHLAGTGGNMPAVDNLLNCELAALAGLQSELSGGKFVALSEVDESARYDGAAYEKIYGKKS